ncbi:MAG: hypothetical protein ABR611_15710, partial [Chthoniobacterales bacterium]
MNKRLNDFRSRVDHDIAIHVAETGKATTIPTPRGTILSMLPTSSFLLRLRFPLSVLAAVL